MFRTTLIAAATSLVLAIAAPAVAAPAQSVSPPIPVALAGHWSGVLVEQGQSLDISIDFTADDAHPSGAFSVDRWGVADYPLGGWKLEGRTVAFGAPGLELDGDLNGDAMSGTFKGDDGTGTFVLHRVAPVAEVSRIIPVTFKNGDIALSGTLVLPTTRGRHAAVVLVHGSGDQSRWGTQRFLAGRLARAGVATLIYDKRGSGQSSGGWRTASYEDLARDALAAVDALAARPEVDPHRIGILGHSEGGIVAPLAATMAPHKVAFLVAEDAPAQTIEDQDIYRVGNDIAAQDWSAVDKALAIRTYRLFVDVAAGDRPFADYEAATAKYGSTAWFQYLSLPPKDHWIWAWYAKRAHLDTSSLWAKVRSPVLLIYGANDQVVSPSDSIIRLANIFRASGVSYAAQLVPYAEHNLTIHPQPGQPFFWWRRSDADDLVIAWITKCAGLNGPCRSAP